LEKAMQNKRFRAPCGFSAHALSTAVGKVAINNNEEENIFNAAKISGLLDDLYKLLKLGKEN